MDMVNIVVYCVLVITIFAMAFIAKDRQERIIALAVGLFLSVLLGCGTYIVMR